jgi:hypothetical protein
LNLCVLEQMDQFREDAVIIAITENIRKSFQLGLERYRGRQTSPAYRNPSYLRNSIAADPAILGEYELKKARGNPQEPIENSGWPGYRFRVKREVAPPQAKL